MKGLYILYFILTFNLVIGQQKFCVEVKTNYQADAAALAIKIEDSVYLEAQNIVCTQSYKNTVKISILLGSEVVKDTLWVIDSKKLLIRISTTYLPSFIFNADPDTVYGDRVMSVYDYSFYRGALLLLNYKNNPRKGGQISWAKDPDYVWNYNGDLTQWSYRFNHDWISQQDTHYKYISIENKAMEVIPLMEYRTQWQPIQLKGTGRALIYSDFIPEFPEANYYQLSMGPKDVHLYKAQDSISMDLFVQSFLHLDIKDKVRAYQYELSTGIPKEIAGGFISGIAYHPYYKALKVCSFFHRNRTVLFDLSNHQVMYYDHRGALIKKQKFSPPHRSEGKWSEEVLYDAAYHVFYTYTMKDAYLHLYQWDPVDAQWIYFMKAQYIFPEKPKVNAGKLYYLYRPRDSNQNVFLYSEKIATRE